MALCTISLQYNDYLQDSDQFQAHKRSLHPDERTQLDIPMWQSSQIIHQAFSVMGPIFHNSLLLNIQTIFGLLYPIMNDLAPHNVGIF